MKQQRGNLDLNQRLVDIKRRRSQAAEHCEGDTEVEELYYEENEDSDSDLTPVFEPKPQPVKKMMKPARKGPTERSHTSSDFPTSSFVPSFDSGLDFS
jgi:hypothetical protein